MTTTSTRNIITSEDSNSPYTDPPKPVTPEIYETSMDTTGKPLQPIFRLTKTEKELPAFNTSIYDIHWIAQIIDQTLCESPRVVTYATN
jgi:hypothetical protein